MYMVKWGKSGRVRKPAKLFKTVIKFLIKKNNFEDTFKLKYLCSHWITKYPKIIEIR